jgi:Putative peptidoglycan binding domain
MTSPQHQRWLAAGAHWRPAVPIAEYVHALQLAFSPPAISVGTIGNQAHLDAEPPEDHTPYSETGWPVTTPEGVVTALDYNGPGWFKWAEFLIAERTAGRHPWIKYINFQGHHYRWQPHLEVTSSSDWKGHVHVSIRSDACDHTTGLSVQQLTGWTPVPSPTSSFGDTIMAEWQTIKLGSTGPRVRDIQALLNVHGTGLATDGIYGPDTESAIAAFQVAHHVPNSVRADGTGDGQAGPQTVLALLDLTS